MLDYREAFRQIGNAKQGFFAPRAGIAKRYLDSQFAKDPDAFRQQNIVEGKLENKVKDRERPIGEYPKFRSSIEKQPAVY